MDTPYHKTQRQGNEDKEGERKCTAVPPVVALRHRLWGRSLSLWLVSLSNHRSDLLVVWPFDRLIEVRRKDNILPPPRLWVRFWGKGPSTGAEREAAGKA
ncbi:MAG: hypothetical protein LBS86_05520 [Treponema sp.]|nr:hypothetical protein [Treponema sp.]